MPKRKISEKSRNSTESEIEKNKKQNQEKEGEEEASDDKRNPKGTNKESSLNNKKSTLSKIAKEKECLRYLSTRCDGIDELLGGGIQEGQVTEIIGATATGKTQLCHTTAFMTAESSEFVIYIDVTNSFSPLRLKQLSSDILKEDEFINLLQFITVYKPHNIYQLFSVTDKLIFEMNKIKDKKLRPSIIILDSISAIFNQISGNDETQNFMAHIGKTFIKMAKNFQLSVLITNNEVGDVNYRNDLNDRNRIAHAMGRFWDDFVHVRIRLTNSINYEIKEAMILKCIGNLDTEMRKRFTIEELGFYDEIIVNNNDINFY